MKSALHYDFDKEYCLLIQVKFRPFLDIIFWILLIKGSIHPRYKNNINKNKENKLLLLYTHILIRNIVFFFSIEISAACEQLFIFIY
jgi:hypothetical protein